MEVAVQMESDAVNNNNNNANSRFAHLLVGASTSFAHPFSFHDDGDDINTNNNNVSVNSSPPFNDKDMDDEFGDFKSVPAQQNGDGQFMWEDDFGSPPPLWNVGGKQCPSPAQDFLFDFPRSHHSTPNFKVPYLCDAKISVLSIGSLDHINASPSLPVDQNSDSRAEIRFPQNGFDEEWGDFVETPAQHNQNSEVEEGLCASHKIIKSFTAKEIDISDDSGRNSVYDPFWNLNSVEVSSGDLDESKSNGLSCSIDRDISKPLPLFFFGVEEELDSKSEVKRNNNVDLLNGCALKGSQTSVGRPNMTSVEFNDFIATLYKQAERGPLVEQNGEDGTKVSGKQECSFVVADKLVGGTTFETLKLNNHPFQNNDEDFESSDLWKFKDDLSQHVGRNVGNVSYAEECSAGNVSYAEECSVVDDNSMKKITSTTSDLFGNYKVDLSHNVSYAEQFSVVVDNSMKKRTSTTSDLFGNHDEDYDSSSWEFKDAFSEPYSHLDGEHVLRHSDQLFNSEGSTDKLREVATFYVKLREYSHSFALSHLSKLEKALLIASEFNNVEEAETITKKIQTARAKLEEANDVSEPNEIEDCHLKNYKNTVMEELLEHLRHSALVVFDSAFFLSEFIPSAKENIKAAVDLYRHTVWVLLLVSTSAEDQFAYLNAWATMTSACVIELQHGLNLWNRASDANVHMHILSHPQGKSYFASLVEIFRVSEIMRASMKLYQPWILLNPDQSKYLSLNLRNCMAVWTESGLKEAVYHAFAKAESENQVTSTIWKGVEEILMTVESMEELCLADAVKSSNQENQSVCKLSLLPTNIFNGMKIVDWCGESYFLPLANLWANCISCKTPKLPVIDFRH